MTDTLIGTFIATLDKRAREQARNWLQSAIHNQRPELVKLFNYLSECILDLKTAPTREKAFHVMYPSGVFLDKTLRLRCNYLLRCLEEWLSWRQWDKADLVKQPYLLNAYREQGLSKHFKQQAQRCRKQLEKINWRNPEAYWQRYQIETAIYRGESTQGRGRPMNLQAQEDALQIALLSSKLRQACLAVAHQRVYKTDYQIAMLDTILHCAQQEPYATEPVVQIYYQVFRMYEQSGNDQAFQSYQTLFFRLAHHFPWIERRDLLLLGVNFCIRRINSGESDYGKNALELYRKGLNEKMLMEEGVLSLFTYHNITSIALGIGELEWAEHFLNDYRNKLPPAEREAAYALNLARLYYQKGTFRDALRLLSQTQQSDFIHDMNARILQLKIFYESDDWQLLAAHLKNTRAYLRRRSSSGYHEQVFSNIFRLADQLYRLPAYDHKQRKQLVAKVKETHPLAEREWLLSKLT